MSGDSLTIFLFLAGTAVAATLAAVSAPKGWRSAFCWSVAVVFTVGVVAFLAKPSSFPLAQTWRLASAVSPLLAVALAIMVMTGQRRGSPVSPKPTPEVTLPQADPPPQPILEQRVFVGPEVTPATFERLFKDNTNIAAKRLSEPYLNKWMKLRGRFVNAGSYQSGHSLSLAQTPGAYHVHITVQPSDNPIVETLQIGQDVAVAGRIDAVERYNLFICDAELIPIAEAGMAHSLTPLPPKKPRAPRKPKPKNADGKFV